VFSSNRRGSWDLWAVPIQNAKTAGEPFLVQADFGNKSKKITRSGKLVYNVSIVMNDVYTLDVNPMTGESPGVPKLITTSHYGKHNTPAWSPDGKKIAYVRNSNLLCVRTFEDGREECIETGTEWFAWISWSPDGKSVALSSFGLPIKSGVYLYSFETGKLSTIFESETPIFSPLGWSLSSKEFLCIRYVTKDEQKSLFDRELVARELVAIDVNTKEKRILERSVNTGWSDLNMAQLSPDCKRMAYVQIDSIRKEIRLVVSDLKDQEKRALVTMDEQKAWILYPIWSPDGRMIEYHLVDPLKQNNGEVRVIAVDGSWEKRIKTGKLNIVTGLISKDAWSPDGTKLAVTLSGGPTGELWAMENFLPPLKVAK
jgi:Tol biopolymer transport system component